MTYTTIVQYPEKNFSVRDIVNLSNCKILVHSIWYSIQGEGVYAGYPAVFVRLAGCNRGAKLDCPWCFPSTEYVDTPDGRQQFRSIKKGQKLLTLNGKRLPDATTVDVVMRSFKDRDDFVVVEYTPEGSSGKKRQIVTGDHPFHTTKRGYVPARSLTITDELFHIAGYERVAIHKAHANPMFNPKVSTRVSDTLRQRYAEGSLLSYERSDRVKAFHSKRMKKRNPMFSSASVAKMVNTKTYPKSGLEAFVEESLQQVSANVRYVGDNSFPIGDEESGYLYPDFLIGRNKVIEVYDPTYPFYAEARHTKVGAKKYEKERTAHFAKFGFKTLFIRCGEDGLLRLNNTFKATGEFFKRVSSFIRNGARIVAVRKLKTVEWNTLLRRQREQFGIVGDLVEVTNFSCSPFNTYTVKGVHVHNCDTNFLVDKASPLSVDELLAKITELIPSGIKPLVVVTGGEPLMHEKAQELSARLLIMGFLVQFETNGDFVRLDTAPGATIVTSPKLSAHTGKYSKPVAGMLERSDYLKLLVSSDPDSPYHYLPDYLPDYVALHGSYNVFISPINEYTRPVSVGEVASMWTDLYDRERCGKNHQYAASLALSNHYRLSLQMHAFVTLP